MKIPVFSSLILLIILLSACSSTKFVPEGEFLLDKMHIKTDAKEIQQSQLEDYIRQTPNFAVFGLFKMQLGLYNIAGKDTTKWYNKLWTRIGVKPVIYNSSLTSISVQQLQRFVENKGYLLAKVQSDVTTKGKKVEVIYTIKSNKPYRLGGYNIELENPGLAEIATDTSRSLVRPNMLFDVDVLNAERERIATRFRYLGYYNFSKDFLSYSADSALGSRKVDVTLELRDYLKRNIDSVNKVIFKRFTIHKVIYYTNSDVNSPTDLLEKEELDTVQFRDFILVTPHKRIVKLDALVQNTYINPKALYSDGAVERTYQALNSLGPIRYVNISFKETSDSLLDCYIVINPGKTVSLSTELEATNTAGYWGVAGKINTVHRNIFRGAETLSLQGRIALERQKDVLAEEYGIQAGLKFPKFMIPFGSYDFKRNIHANTEYTSAFSYQLRPGEFTTKSVGAGINYLWNRRQYRHSFQLVDLNYVFFPEISTAFRDSFLINGLFNPNNYKDHFIMRMGYSGSYSNFSNSRPMQNYSTLRYSIETAGNFLYGLDHLLGNAPSPSDGFYKLFGIRYSQYVKAEYNVTHHQIIDKNNRFVYHLGAGVGVPYGNADVIPYERRFFSGGANSVRGWSESTLGPGAYDRNINQINKNRRDYNQVGDIKLDLNMEYRAKMVWLMEGALFLDAGNIWTIQDYPTQAAGTFKFDSFMNQIAIAYGLGLRFDFSFFIFRADFGMKLFDPVKTRPEQWRVNPTWDDFAFHLAIGYPF